jgi:hypothetical protein
LLDDEYQGKREVKNESKSNPDVIRQCAN